MALFGRRLTAERALALGFAAEISDDPLSAARAIAAKLSDTSPAATEVAKYMIHAAAGEDRGAMIEALGGGMIAASRRQTGGRRRLPRQAQTCHFRENDMTALHHHPGQQECRSCRALSRPALHQRQPRCERRWQDIRACLAFSWHCRQRLGAGWRSGDEGSHRGGARGLRRWPLEPPLGQGAGGRVAQGRGPD